MYQGSPDEPANVDEVENLRNELTRLNTALEVVKQRLAGMAATNDLSISTADPMQTDGELTSQQLKDLEAELLGGIQKQLESERMWEEERGCGEQSQPRTVRELKESVRGMSEELERLVPRKDSSQRAKCFL